MTAQIHHTVSSEFWCCFHWFWCPRKSLARSQMLLRLEHWVDVDRCLSSIATVRFLAQGTCRRSVFSFCLPFQLHLQSSSARVRIEVLAQLQDVFGLIMFSALFCSVRLLRMCILLIRVVEPRMSIRLFQGKPPRMQLV